MSIVKRFKQWLGKRDINEISTSDPNYKLGKTIIGSTCWSIDDNKFVPKELEMGQPKGQVLDHKFIKCRNSYAWKTIWRPIIKPEIFFNDLYEFIQSTNGLNISVVNYNTDTNKVRITFMEVDSSNGSSGIPDDIYEDYTFKIRHFFGKKRQTILNNYYKYKPKFAPNIYSVSIPRPYYKISDIVVEIDMSL